MRRRRVGEELKFCSVSPRVGNVKNKGPGGRSYAVCLALTGASDG
jgi:hypothetical protein